MAIDHALLESAAAASPAVRLYRWSPACLSLGRNQPARGRYDTAEAERRGIHIVRRPTGGLAVYHDRELTYAVAAPVSVVGKPRAAYRAINRALARGFRRLGVTVELAGDGGPAGGLLGSGPCFHEGAPGEVLAGGKKLVGSAQRCESRTILQHGSILLEGEQREAAELEVKRPTADRRPPTAVGSRGEPGGREAGAAGSAGLATPAALSATSLARVLGEVPGDDALVAVFVAGFEDELAMKLEPVVLTESEGARAAELETRYRSEAWTWRR